MKGINDFEVRAIPHAELQQVLRKYNRLVEPQARYPAPPLAVGGNRGAANRDAVIGVLPHRRLASAK